MARVPSWMSQRARTRRWQVATLVATSVIAYLIVPAAGIGVMILGFLVLVALWRPDPPLCNDHLPPEMRRADDSRPGKDVRDTSFGHIIGLPPSGGGGA